MKDSKFLDRPSSMWLTIAGLVISFAVSLAILQSNVRANVEDIREYRQIILEMDDKIDSLLVSQASMSKDVEYIKSAVIVVQDN